MIARTTTRGALVALAAAALAAPLAAPAFAAAEAPLASGLSGPLGLAVGEGGVYVAQAFPGENAPSKLTVIDEDGEQRDIATAPDGEIAGVDVTGSGHQGRDRRHITYVTTGGTEEGGPYAMLRAVRPSGRISTLADLQKWEVEQNPDADVHYGFASEGEDALPADCEVPDFLGGALGYDGIVEAHPYATANLADGSSVVADAAGNTLVKVSLYRQVSTLAVLPAQPLELTAEAVEAINAGIDQGNEGVPPEEQMPHVPECVIGHSYDFEAVPTDVEVGPDGMLYVSTLAGGPEDPSLGARGAVYKVHPTTGRTTEVARGFMGATNLAVSPDGDIYVAELFGGQISKVVDGGPETVSEQPLPAAVEWADGKLYATINAFGDGSVVTIEP